MPKQISIAKIMDAAIKGISNAQRDYEIWSGGLWLWEAPEYLAGTYLAQEIARVAGKDGPWYLTMEHSTKQAIEDAGAAGSGKLHRKIRPKGRFDLLLWWGSETPRAPIEIKCQVTEFEKIRADIERLEKVIHRKESESSFQFGMSVFYTSAKDRTGKAAKEKTERRIAQIISAARSHIGADTELVVKKSAIKMVDDSAWSVVALVLKLLK